MSEGTAFLSLEARPLLSCVFYGRLSADSAANGFYGEVE